MDKIDFLVELNNRGCVHIIANIIENFSVSEICTTIWVSKTWRRIVFTSLYKHISSNKVQKLNPNEIISYERLPPVYFLVKHNDLGLLKWLLNAFGTRKVRHLLQWVILRVFTQWHFFRSTGTLKAIWDACQQKKDGDFTGSHLVSWKLLSIMNDTTYWNMFWRNRIWTLVELLMGLQRLDVFGQVIRYCDYSNWQFFPDPGCLKKMWQS